MKHQKTNFFIFRAFVRYEWCGVLILTERKVGAIRQGTRQSQRCSRIILPRGSHRGHAINPLCTDLFYCGGALALATLMVIVIIRMSSAHLLISPPLVSAAGTLRLLVELTIHSSPRVIFLLFVLSLLILILILIPILVLTLVLMSFTLEISEKLA